MRSSRTVVTMIFLLGFLVSGTLWAQSTGTIAGTVEDDTGGVIPGAEVTALNQGTGVTRLAITNDAGRYTLPLLPIGDYTVSVTMDGFARTEVPDIDLEVGQSREVDITLEVAQLATDVTVTSGVADVDLQKADATLGQVVHSEQVANLPLNGRNFVQLALLASSTTEGRTGSFLKAGPSSEVSYRGTMSVSAQGNRENANDWLYDGIDNNELSAGGVSILPSIESIAEFKVLTYNFEAKYGARGGTTILVSTKSGTNEFHGSAFWYNRDDAFDARNFFDGPEKGTLSRHQYGFSLGGPIVKGRTFFFGGVELTNLEEGLTIQSTVPTAGMLAGDFSGPFSETIYDPTTTRTDPATGMQMRDPFPGNIIPEDRIDPIGRSLAGLLPTPTRSDRLLNNYLSNPAKTLDVYNIYGRVDHEITDQDKLFVRLAIEDGEQYLPSGVPEFAARSPWQSNQTFTTDALNAAVAYTHLFSPSTINNVTAGYNKVFNYITSFGYGSNKARELGIPGANLGGEETSSLTQISLASPFIDLGDRGYSPFQGGTNVYHLTDTLTLVRGNHTLNVGGTTRANQLNLLGDNFLSGRFSFDRFFTAGFSPSGSLDASTGNPVASMLLGLPAWGQRSNQLQGSVKGRRWKEYRGFMDDTWKVNPDLTLTLGLAYAVTTPQSEAAGRFSNFDFYTGRYFVGGTVGVKTDYSNIQPRFGFAWSPGGSTNTVIRGGYGIYHDVSAQSGASGPYQNPPFANAYSFFTNNIEAGRTLSTGFPDNSEPRNPEDHMGDWTATAVDYRQGRVQQWNLNVERKLPGSMVFMVAYAATRGDHLFKKNRNLNSAPPGPGFNSRSRRPYPNLNTVNTTLSDGILNYHSMQLRLERRATRGGFLLATYTWSKGLTDGQTGLGGDPGTVYFPYRPHPSADYASTNTDLRHNFKLSYLYELPFGSNLTGVAGAIAKGWNLNSILVAHSGYPLAMGVSNQSGTGLGNRPDRICDGKLSNPTIDLWFDPECFVAPPPGQFGNAARTTLFGPGRWNIDISMSKAFRVTEDGDEIQFRAEFFNAFNHAQFQTPGTFIPFAGNIGSTTTTSRQIQFALKYVF